MSTPLPQARSRPEKAVLAIPLAVLLTLVLNIVTFLVLHVSVPRVSEGNRQTIALPWASYAVLAHVVPPILTFAICSLHWRSARHLILVAFLAGLTEFLWFQYSGAHLLHRDWIGKF